MLEEDKDLDVNLRRIKVAWFLFKLAFKIRTMSQEKRCLYLASMRVEIDLSLEMTINEKKALHKYLNKIEEGLVSYD